MTAIAPLSKSQTIAPGGPWPCSERSSRRRARGWLDGQPLKVATSPAELAVAIAERGAISEPLTEILPMTWLAERLRLSSEELDALWLLISIEYDPLVARLARATTLGAPELSLQLWRRLTPISWALSFEGAIVLLEEIGEQPYKIDRYLTQLTLTRAIAGTAAFVLGELTRCEPGGADDPPDIAQRVVIERIAAAGKPLATGAPVGTARSTRRCRSVPRCELDLDSRTFAILDAAVA